ncbi:MAG: hypothetical protein JNJ54_23680 [Myxococcaceae bacterium]|nr:hypothetical protein [Myxococcaceae bacterium]
MRALLPAVALVWCACPSPENVYRLEGEVVDQNGRAVRGREVRLLRDASDDGARCLPMEPFAVTTTGPNGRFAFDVYRYQQTLGRVTPRFFRVEASNDPLTNVLTSWTFRFPAVDVTLPPLPITTSTIPPLPSSFETFSEASLDGVVAWRTGGGIGGDEERPMKALQVTRGLASDVLAGTPFGSWEQVGLELRLEQPIAEVPPGPVSRLRGLDCEQLRPAPCPLTDGRMLPVALPPGTKTLTITGRELVVFRTVVLRGLRIDGEAAQVTVETTDSLELPDWQLSGRLLRGKELVAAARGHCREPGVFGSIEVGVRAARGVRIRADDEDGNSLDLTSVQEVSAR